MPRCPLACHLRPCSIRWNESSLRDRLIAVVRHRFKNGTILVNCQKTKGHAGREFRITPLFPELRQELEAWRAEAPKDREFVLKPAISPKTNLRTGLIKILKRAKIKRWPKLYQNLRATRAKELRRRFDPAVVAAWLGHTVDIADKHYVHVSDDDIRRAVE